jgi:hypothetical protein
MGRFFCLAVMAGREATGFDGFASSKSEQPKAGP